MPDPVSCHVSKNDPSLIECDPVLIGPERPTAAVQKSNAEPGVRALVAGQEPPLIVRGYEPARVTNQVDPLELGRECGPTVLGAVVGVVGAAKLHPALGVLSALKLGIDIGKCVEQTVVDATQRASEERALEMCAEAGGTAVGAVNGTFVCERQVVEE